MRIRFCGDEIGERIYVAIRITVDQNPLHERVTGSWCGGLERRFEVMGIDPMRRKRGGEI